MFEAFKWTVALASLVGVELNIRHRRECFVVWIATNAAWTVVDLIHGVWAQAFLQFLYLLLAIRGLRVWNQKG